MTEQPGISPRQDALREDLNKEYYALMGVVSDYDGRFMIIKGWSVTLSLAALGIGFQQGHYALFGLGAATALAFWSLEILMKGYQMRSYSRMRDIELAAYHINAVELENLGLVSAPRVDMSWGYRGQARDWRIDAPKRRNAASIRRQRWLRFVMPNVWLPHAVAALLGVYLFVAAVSDAAWLGSMEP